MSIALHTWIKLYNKIWIHLSNLVSTTLGPAYYQWNEVKETARYKSVLFVTELFNTTVNDFNAKKSACFLIVTELFSIALNFFDAKKKSARYSGTQCTFTSTY